MLLYPQYRQVTLDMLVQIHQKGIIASHFVQSENKKYNITNIFQMIVSISINFTSSCPESCIFIPWDASSVWTEENIIYY